MRTIVPRATSGKPYGASFPDVTVRDSVRLHIRLLKEGLGVKRIAFVIGGKVATIFFSPVIFSSAVLDSHKDCILSSYSLFRPDAIFDVCLTGSLR